MASKFIPNIELENATIIYPNFSGKEGRFNREGDRFFSVFIDDAAQAQEMAEDGWNVKIRKPRDEDEEPRYYIQVAVNYNFYKKPEIYRIINGRKFLLEEEDLGQLDSDDILSADMVIRPRIWDDNGTTRIKAYLSEMYVTIQQSRFAAKYAEEEAPEEVPF